MIHFSCIDSTGCSNVLISKRRGEINRKTGLTSCQTRLTIKDTFIRPAQLLRLSSRSNMNKMTLFFKKKQCLYRLQQLVANVTLCWFHGLYFFFALRSIKKLQSNVSLSKTKPVCQNSAVFGALSNVFTSGFIYTLFIDGTLHSPKVDVNTNLKTVNFSSIDCTCSWRCFSFKKKRREKEKRKHVNWRGVEPASSEVVTGLQRSAELYIRRTVDFNTNLKTVKFSSIDIHSMGS